MKPTVIFRNSLFGLSLLCAIAISQERNYNPFPMSINVGRFRLDMNKINGDGGLQSQYSWNLTGSNPQKTEIFYWPQDQWQSNILYQIFNPLSLDDNGILDEFGNRQIVARGGPPLTNPGVTDWSIQVRRYRPPTITVNGINLVPPYRWYVDRTLKSDLKIEFEDVLSQFGIRSHVEIFAFSNPNHADYMIWKATHKFTGEIRRPRELTGTRDSLPDQTINFWWPIAFSFGPSKAGEYSTFGAFSYEGEDDLDSWFKMKQTLVPGAARDSLAVAYYWDGDEPNSTGFSNGSTDDVGDPDRTTGFLHSVQIPGYALLYADQSATNKVDDPVQPYSLPHATIALDLWGRRDNGLKLTYRGDDGRGRFPMDAISAGFSTRPQKGPMRFVTAGPYSLTKNTAQARYDSLTFVYAVGVGSIGWVAADSIGRLWMNKDITDQQKDQWVLKGKDSLAKALDHAYWAWNRLSKGLTVPASPPPPDVVVTSGPDRIIVGWSYPDPSYFEDANTNVDDWYAWRVYRKRGAYAADDPLDQKNGDRWQLIFETTNRTQSSYIDTSIQRGVDYYYAVTAVDDGTQNDDPSSTGQRLESSRYENASQLPAVSFKPGLNQSNQILVVPNPATVAAGALGFSGTPNKLLFVNLPVKCNLKIYTETGDLVKTIEHYGTGDHAWDQRTDNNQYVTSGIYILAAVDCEDINGRKLDSQFVKFVLVR